MANGDTNQTILRIGITSVIVVIIALVAFLNSSKVNAEVFQMHVEYNKMEISEVKEELKEINKKMDILLTHSGYTKSDLEKKLKGL